MLASIADAQNNVTSFEYDARGNEISQTDALNETIGYAYDAMNRLINITYPDNSTTRFAYDYRGRRLSVTDANGNTTTYGYDDADHLTSVMDAAKNVTAYGYDTENHLASITDAVGHVTSFSYDPLGRVTQVTFPSNLTESYTYDADGDLLSNTDRNGHTINYTYDNLNRLVAKSYPDSTAVSYTYDSVSRPTHVTDPSGTYSFTYDNLGRVTAATVGYSFLTGSNYSVGYTYDAASSRLSMTNAQGGASGYVYDTLNRLTSLTDAQSSQFAFTYDTVGRRTGLTRSNGVATGYNYDALSRLLSVLHQSGGNSIDGATYAYDPAGTRASKTQLPGGTASSYAYDAQYQLLQVVQSGNATELYSHDAVGNRLTSLGIPGYSYNSSNELMADSAASYTYDSNGNTLSKTDTSGTTRYAWDFENRLSSVTLPSGATVSFKYDPFGRRTEKTGPNGTTVYVYDGDNVIEELDGSGNVVAAFTQGLGIDEPLAVYESGQTYYYEADGLGSITSLSDPTGKAVESYVYDSFGNPTASTGSVPNPFQYTAREFDSDTGLDYYRARYYDPQIGRFMSEDPIRFVGGENFYAYVENDPINSVDPLGLAQCLYEVGKHTLTCVSTADPSNQIVIGGGSTHSGASGCKDKNGCEGLPFLGPIPRGKYRMNKDPRPEHPTWYRLESIPPVRWWEYYTGLRRSGFALHLGTLSEGCINVDKTNPAAAQQYQQLLQLLDSEQGDNFLFVEP